MYVGGKEEDGLISFHTGTEVEKTMLRGLGQRLPSTLFPWNAQGYQHSCWLGGTQRSKEQGCGVAELGREGCISPFAYAVERELGPVY